MMNTNIPKLIAGLSTLLLATAPFAQAVQINGLTLGQDITVNDKNNAPSTDPTHGGTGNLDTRLALPYGATIGTKIRVKEDEEVEYTNGLGSATWGQSWDLEAVFFDKASSRLSIVGGYDFAKGNLGYKSGDLMIDVTPFGNQNGPASLNYVVDFNWNDSFNWAINQTSVNINYSIYKLGDGNDGYFTASAYFGSSDPWRYTAARGEVAIDTGVATVFKFTTGLTTDEGYTLQGTGTRYALMIGGDSSVDTGAYAGISAILADANVQSFGGKFTMGCGNDEIVGWHGVPDSGMTLILLGGSLLGMALIRRRN